MDKEIEKKHKTLYHNPDTPYLFDKFLDEFCAKGYEYVSSNGAYHTFKITKQHIGEDDE
jgi:hypothetical protein